MPAFFEPPPTYASPIQSNKQGEMYFNPIWLKWFLDLTQFISQSQNGVSGTIPLAMLTVGGTTGSLVFNNGILTSFTTPT